MLKRIRAHKQHGSMYDAILGLQDSGVVTGNVTAAAIESISIAPFP